MPVTGVKMLFGKLGGFMKQSKKPALIVLAVIVVIGLAAGIAIGVKGGKKTSEKTSGESGTATSEVVSETTEKSSDSEEYTDSTPVVTDVDEEDFQFTEGMNDIAFTKNGNFYSEDFVLKVFSRKGGTIYYTLDGSSPLENGTEYSPEEGIPMESTLGTQPNIYPLSVAAVYEDGTDSGIYVHTYFVGAKVSSRYTTVIFNIVGNPDELDNGPDGIFYGDNYSDRGIESERMIHLEAFESDGTQILSQFAGVRVYGGYSRQNWQKSMKFFARSSYDENNSSFRLSCIDELRLDGTNTQILNFDKFVLRDSGNDYQFAYIRDELNQTLGARAGYDDYEAVRPAICYRNGKYVGLFWLHVSYCDDYFKDKYGSNPSLPEDSETEGEFYVLEGGDSFKSSDENDETVTALADAYEETYDDFVDRGVTDDSVYKELCDWMDVENYLDYFAFNIYLNNKDWPQNNYKCYAYVAADGESYTEGTVFDGKWRYLLHDADYTLGLYEQQETVAGYDTLKVVMNPSSDRYAPLFTALMDREDCREYFVKKMQDLANGAFSYESLTATLRSMNAERETEMTYYYNFLESSRDPSVWTNAEHFAGYTEIIGVFAKTRPNRSASYLKSKFALGSLYTLTVTNDGGSKLQINSYTTDAGADFTGSYFEDYATTVSAVVPYGKVFDYWEVNGVKNTAATLSVTASDIKDGAVTIVLHVKDDTVSGVYLSRISARDTDYVVLTNSGSSDSDVGGYTISADDAVYTIPANTVIAAGETLTIYANAAEKDPPENALSMDAPLSAGVTVVCSDGKTELANITLPKTHSGYVLEYDLFTRTYYETKAPEE